MSKPLAEQVLFAYIIELKVQLNDAENILFIDLREKVKAKLNNQIKDAQEAFEWVRG